MTCDLYIWMSFTLARRSKTWSLSCHRIQNCPNENIHRMFSICLCLGQIVPELPNVSLGSPDRSSTAIDLADVIEPLQSYLLVCSTEQNIFSSADSVSSCVEMIADLGIRQYNLHMTLGLVLIFMFVQRFMPI